MSLLSIRVSDVVQEAAYNDLARGAMRKFGDAVSVLSDRILNPRHMSREELMQDWQMGEEASENRRRLAAEALDRVPPSRRIFSAPQIVGTIFRKSEFELPETPIWDMWRALLARASDSEHVGKAHPAYPGIVSQLSPDEAKLLRIMYKSHRLNAFSYRQHVWNDGPMPVHDSSMLPQWENVPVSGSMIGFYVSHLKQLNLIRIEVAGRHDEPKFEGSDDMIATSTVTCHLTDWGMAFLMAVMDDDR